MPTERPDVEMREPSPFALPVRAKQYGGGVEIVDANDSCLLMLNLLGSIDDVLARADFIAAAADAAARDEVLTKAANLLERVLVEMGSPGAAWLDLADLPAAPTTMRGD